MVHKGQGKKSKKPRKKVSTPPSTESNITMDEMLGSEIASDHSFSQRDDSSIPSTLPVSQPTTKSLIVTATTSTVPNTSKSLSSSNQSENSNADGSMVYDPPTDPNFTESVTEEQADSPLNQEPNKSIPSRRKSSAPRKTTRSNTKAMQEIARLQSVTTSVVPKLPFARLIREVLNEYSHHDMRITAESLMCLQESAETYVVQLMEDAYRCTVHRERITLMPKDIRLAVMLRKDSIML
ncbi:uncharacterized protein LOC131680671 [Topomyia yanbarensis]|uniref:uncharacterized protein LOC131680671 n=1 Tax=Topomyia yanbarensis TaxID=2498891 RepID=UPI00273AFDCB|nr:uncharacterized protein LOC131680671 [Topomyia yanbarensis]